MKIDAEYYYCFITKSATNYSFRAVSYNDLQSTLITPLAQMTGFDQYVGMKKSYYELLWTEKTAYVQLRIGFEFISTTF